MSNPAKNKRKSSSGKAVSKSTTKRANRPETMPIQPVDEIASIHEQEENEIFNDDSEADETESEDEISSRFIVEAEERIRFLSETNTSLNRKLSAKLKLLELEEQQKSLELSIADARRRLTSDNSIEILNSNVPLVQIQTDGLEISRSIGDAPPAKTGTIFVNDDNIIFVCMDKKKNCN